MASILVILLPAFVLFGIIAIIISFRCFDQLLRTEVSLHLEEWERHGRPIGFFWVPAGTKVTAGSFARTTLWGIWAATPPSWLGEDGANVARYRRFRTAYRMGQFFIGVAAVIILMLIIYLSASGVE